MFGKLVLNITVIFLLVYSCLLTSCGSEKKTSSPSNTKTMPQKRGGSPYNAQEIELLRREKDAAFQQAGWSPLREFDKKRFRGLRYYEASPEYCIEATFIPMENPASVLVETTQQNDVRSMRQVGVLRFLLGSDSCSLIVFCDKKTFDTNPSEAVLSVYFKDKTNGSETYSGGRYLEMPYLPGAGSYILNFNQAFNPYCAYNDEYSCPLVPEKNMLAVFIRAGEKLYQQP